MRRPPDRASNPREGVVRAASNWPDVRAYRSGACFALIACLMTCSTARAADVDPLAIFAKHTAAVGYSLSDGRAKPYMLESASIDRDTGKTNVNHHEQAGAYFRNTYTRNGRSSGWGFDGHGFWIQNRNGNVLYELGLGLQYDIAWAVIGAESFGPELSPEMMSATANDYVVRIHPASAMPADVYFNKSTYLIDRAVVNPAGVPETVDYGDYRRNGPVMVAMTVTSGETVSKVTKFEWDAPLPAADFDVPARRSYASFPPTGSSAVPFDDKRDSIAFDATVNGVKGHFVLDTGADGVYLTPAFAAKAHLTPLDTTSGISVGGQFGLAATRIGHFKIGDVDLSDFYAWIGSKGDVDGYVGYDVLAQVVCDVDFDKKQLTLTNPAVYAGDPKRGALVVALDNFTPEIQALVNTKRQVFMTLDTGDGSSMTFFRTFVDQNPGIVARGAEARFVGAGGETQSGYIGTLDEIDIGPYKFFGLEADVLGGFSGLATSRLRQGLIGYQMLRRFDLTFDYAENKVYLGLSKYGNETKF